jgi:hypothetical protein
VPEDEIVLINVPGPGDASTVEIVGSGDGVISVPTPVGDPALAARVGALEVSDAEQDDRLLALELSGGGGGIDPDAVQELIDDTVAVHVAAPEPHPAYDDIPSLTLLFQNGLV